MRHLAEGSTILLVDSDADFRHLFRNVLGSRFLWTRVSAESTQAQPAVRVAGA